MRTRSALGFAGIGLANACVAVVYARTGAPTWSAAISLGCGTAFSLLALREFRRDEYEFASGWVERVHRLGSVLFLLFGLGFGIFCLGLLALEF